MRIHPLLVASALLGLPTAAHADWQSRTIAGMDTRIYTPASTSPIGEGRGLLIVLHGCTQTADHLRDHGNFEPAADDFGMLVVLPNVPGGGVYAGCWSYYGPIHSRTGGHAGPVIEMVQTLVAEPQHLLDPAQVYLAGFSAGGGQAVVLGCLAPDLFAGVGVAAGPAVGTTGDDISQVGTSVEQATPLCESLAGSYADDFATQLAVTYTDTSDFIVAQGYAELNAKMYGELFAGGVAAMTASPIDVAALPGIAPTGTGTQWADTDGPRVAWIVTSGNSHAWPSGSGVAAPPLAFVSGGGLDLAYTLAEFFTANNRRASGDWMPGDDGTLDDGGDAPSDDANDDAMSDADDPEPATDDAADDAAPNDDDDVSDAMATTAAMNEHIDPTGCQCRSDPREGDRHRDTFALVAIALALGTSGRRRRRRYSMTTPS